MLKANFNITETGGTGIVQLQRSTDQGATWQGLGSPLTLSRGALSVDDSTGLDIDPSVFLPGQTYDFRLVDQAGSPVSSTVTYTIPSIRHYAAGTGLIGFTPTIGDHYEVTFHAAPDTILASDGATGTGVRYSVEFWHQQNTLQIIDEQTPQLSDQVLTIGGNGPGVYLCKADYMLSSGLGFGIARFVKVDGSGAILADIQANGSTAISVSGLDVTETADFIQTGVSYPVRWIAFDGSSATLMGSGTTATFTLPVDTVILICTLDIDSVFSDDFAGDVTGYAHNIAISS